MFLDVEISFVYTMLLLSDYYHTLMDNWDEQQLWYKVIFWMTIFWIFAKIGWIIAGILIFRNEWAKQSVFWMGFSLFWLAYIPWNFVLLYKKELLLDDTVTTGQFYVTGSITFGMRVFTLFYSDKVRKNFGKGLKRHLLNLKLAMNGNGEDANSGVHLNSQIGSIRTPNKIKITLDNESSNLGSENDNLSNSRDELASNENSNDNNNDDVENDSLHS